MIFASTSRSKWVGGTDAEVAYDTRGEGKGKYSIRAQSIVLAMPRRTWSPGREGKAQLHQQL